MQQQWGLLGRLTISRSLWEHAELLYRDRRMVARLGHIAAGMSRGNPEDPPHLNFTAGEAHRPGVTRLLTANEVPFTEHSLSPDYARRNAARTVRAALSILPFVQSVGQKDIKDWRATVRRAAAVE